MSIFGFKKKDASKEESLGIELDPELKKEFLIMRVDTLSRAISNLKVERIREQQLLTSLKEEVDNLKDEVKILKTLLQYKSSEYDPLMGMSAYIYGMTLPSRTASITLPGEKRSCYLEPKTREDNGFKIEKTAKKK